MKARVPKNATGGTPQNMTSMIKQAQKMQNDITALQNEIELRTFNATVGGGAVEIEMTGKKTINKLTIKPEAAEDIEMLQDLIISAVNQCVADIEDTTENEMETITGGVSLPGLF